MVVQYDLVRQLIILAPNTLASGSLVGKAIAVLVVAIAHDMENVLGSSITRSRSFWDCRRPQIEEREGEGTGESEEILPLYLVLIKLG